MDPATRREIEEAVRDALVPFAVAGTVVVRGGQIELHAGQSATAIDLDLVGEQWPLLPAEMRKRKAEELARRLAEAVRRTRASMGTPSKPRNGGLSPSIVAAVVIAATAGVVLYTCAGKSKAKVLAEASSAAASAAGESPEESSARRARVCEATRRRIYAGSSIGPFDREGWVAELWLARQGQKALVASAAITKLAEGSKLSASADAELAKLSGTVEVAEPPSTPKGWQAVVLRFSGAYIDSFLDPSGRARFVSLADRTAEAAGAEMGALYARCAHLKTHEIGAWFVGTDAKSASASLLYAMGLFAEMPAVNRARLGAASELAALRDAGAELDSAKLAALVGTNGGSITSTAAAVTLTFPLGGPIRATSASREVARHLKLAD